MTTDEARSGILATLRTSTGPAALLIDGIHRLCKTSATGWHRRSVTTPACLSCQKAEGGSRCLPPCP
jgi:hypothetical protein